MKKWTYFLKKTCFFNNKKVFWFCRFFFSNCLELLSFPSQKIRIWKADHIFGCCLLVTVLFSIPSFLPNILHSLLAASWSPILHRDSSWYLWRILTRFSGGELKGLSLTILCTFLYWKAVQVLKGWMLWARLLICQ